MKIKKISRWLEHLAVKPIKKHLHPKVYQEVKHILDNPTTSLSTLDAMKTLTESFVKHGKKKN